MIYPFKSCKVWLKIVLPVNTFIPHQLHWNAEARSLQGILSSEATLPHLSSEEKVHPCPRAPVIADLPGGLMGVYSFTRARITQDIVSKNKRNKYKNNLLEGYQGISWTSETERGGRPCTKNQASGGRAKQSGMHLMHPFPRGFNLSPLCMFPHICFSCLSLK